MPPPPQVQVGRVQGVQGLGGEGRGVGCGRQPQAGEEGGQGQATLLHRYSAALPLKQNTRLSTRPHHHHHHQHHTTPHHTTNTTILPTAHRHHHHTTTAAASQAPERLAFTSVRVWWRGSEWCFQGFP
ncbi:hypothetical protein E2C01_076659 [Portunus trituberculatus]|uniref:Uncharacterized protein n=1 Tax=Portunus trituberculatus TaxID=210409 RepID=A0A5B7IJA9_PORTR|nr:hypothetical protein [Portunus trituberculatus]